ncbi:MAG: VWA domain-containing protein [Blastocatellia bacterium]
MQAAIMRLAFRREMSSGDFMHEEESSKRLTMGLAALCIAICLAPPARGQDRLRDSQSVLRLETELVQLDVVVTDKQGRLVRDLKREEFALFEDGKPVALSHFAIGTASRPAALPGRPPRTPAGAPASAAPAVSAGRYLVLAVDDLHLAAGNLPYAKNALTRFIDSQMSDEDQVALVTTSGALGLYQQFTSDREALRRAVGRLAPRDRTDAGDLGVPRITPYQAELIDQGDTDALEIAVRAMVRQTAGGQGDQTERALAAREAQSRARAILQQNTHATIATLRTIEEVIRSLQPLGGRKVVAFFSDGFLLGGARDGRHYDLRRIADAAVRAGVTIYSLDTRGLSAGPAAVNVAQPFNDMPQDLSIRMRIESGTIEGMRDGMHSLARDTGGLPLFNSNDLTQGIARLLEDTEVYYLLAFEPLAPVRDGRFRKLDVRLPGRPDLKVRSRAGYFAPNDKLAEAELAPIEKPAKTPAAAAKAAEAALQRQIREGIGALFPLRGIPVSMTAGFVHLPEGSSAADIAAHIDASGLKFDPNSGRHRAILEFVGMVFDEAGNVAERFNDRLDLNLRSKTMEHSLRNGLLYSRFVRLKPGAYQVRIAIREEGFSPLGSASAWIEIPDLNRKELALSSIVLGQTEDDPEAAAPHRKASGELEENRAASLPAKVYRRFGRDARFNFLVFTYNAQLNPKGSTNLVIQSQVYAGDRIVLATPVQRITEQNSPDVKKNASRGVPYRARLSLEEFAAGKYELRLIVIDRLAKTSARRSIPFTVE